MTSGDRRVMSGFPSLDKIIGGFRPGSLNIISGRPGSGKTSLAINVAYNAATKYNKRVIFYSLEESKTEIANRVLLFAPEDPQDTAKCPLYIDDRIGSYEEIQLNLREEIEKTHPDLIIIDYLELLSPDVESRESGMAMATSFLKQLATEYDVPVIVLRQISRGCFSVDDKLKYDEAKWYGHNTACQESDVIIIIWWEGYSSRHNRQVDIRDVHLYVAKNNYGDRDVNATVKWEPSIRKYFEEE